MLKGELYYPLAVLCTIFEMSKSVIYAKLKAFFELKSETFCIKIDRARL